MSMEFEVEVVAETSKALCCKIDGKDHWFPKSQIEDDTEVAKKGDKGKLVISDWIAKEKNLA